MSDAAKPTPSPSSAPTRTESDAMGKMDVPADRYYGAQTARSLIHFAIGKDTMPPELIRAFPPTKQNLSRNPRTKSSPANSTLISHCASGKPAAARRPT